MTAKGAKQPRYPKSKFLNDQLMKRVTLLREIYGYSWPDIAQDINQSFGSQMNGLVIPWQTLYGRYQASLKKRKAVNPKATEKLVRKIFTTNEIGIKSLMNAVLQGDPRSIEAMIKLNEQSAKLHGAFAPEKHKIDHNSKIELNMTDDTKDVLSSIAEKFNSKFGKKEDD